MTIVVAGAAGFIGSHLCDRLLDAGHEVVGIDNLSTGRRSNLAEAMKRPAFRFVEHDITKPFPELGPVSEIYHLASPASPADFASMPIEILDAGSVGTRGLLELAQRHGARLLLASTSEVYGDPLEHPQRETYWGNVDPIGPRSCYDEAKRFSEALVTAFRQRRGVDTVIIRIFNTYGPRMRPGDGRVLANFIEQAIEGADITLYGGGEQTRSFCFVDDEVRGIMAAMASGLTGPFNIGNPTEIRIREVAEMVVGLTSSSSRLLPMPMPPDREGDPVRRRPDITLATRDLHWSPTIGLDEGLRRMIDDFRRERGSA